MPIKFTCGVKCSWICVFIYFSFVESLFADGQHTFLLKREFFCDWPLAYFDTSYISIFPWKNHKQAHLWASVRNQADGGNLSVKDLSHRSTRTSLTHSEGALEYIYLHWSPGVIMITVSRDALFSDRADTAEYKLKENQIFFSLWKSSGVGEGRNLSFHVVLLAISRLSRRLSTRKFQQRCCTGNREAFAVEWSGGRQPRLGTVLLSRVSPMVTEAKRGSLNTQTPLREFVLMALPVRMKNAMFHYKFPKCENF